MEVGASAARVAFEGKSIRASAAHALLCPIISLSELLNFRSNLPIFFQNLFPTYSGDGLVRA